MEGGEGHLETKLVFEVINVCAASILMAPCPFAGCLVPNGCVQVAHLAEPGGVGYTLQHSPAVITDIGDVGGGSDLRRDAESLLSFFFLPSAGNRSVTMRADELQGL